MQTLNGKIQDYYGAQQLVFGEGEIPARVMLIGEAPGREEIKAGRPFCGKAGKNLNEFLEIAGMQRSGLYVSNVCKFRPQRLSEKGTVSNRPPKKEEIMAAIPFLYEEIRIVSPRLIVTLGNTPLRACFGDFGKNIGQMHGEKTAVDVSGVAYDLYPLYHPASVIYNPALRQTYIDDLRKLHDCVTGCGLGVNLL